MKATIYMATYDKNDLLPNTLYSIVRQEVPFSYEVCIIDDCSPVDPEPIIREFIPDAKYKRLEKQAGFDVVTTYALDLAAPDADILIMQSADVIHVYDNTIERLCKGVSEKTCCMAVVRNAKPDPDLYKDFENRLPIMMEKRKKGGRTGPGTRPSSYFFFLGAVRRKDFESIPIIKKPHCDNLLADYMRRNGFKTNYPKGLEGIHQNHPQTTVPCTSLASCKRHPCPLRNRCRERGWKSIEDYWKWLETQK